jgi:histidinol-phosphate aminotransferase
MLRRTVRLHMNEVPYPPSQDVIEAAGKGLSELNRYADPVDLEQLRGLLADYVGVPRRYMVLGPGSDLLLREMLHTSSVGRQVITVRPSFFPTVQAARQFAAKQLSIRLSPPRFDLPQELLVNALDEPSLVIIDNPNNPTGSMLLDRQAVKAIVGHNDSLLVVDEAYYEFSDVTSADLVSDHPNLVVVRTMDKAFGLAGARIGYATAGETALDRLASFYAFLPRPSLYAAIEALQHPGYMRENVRRIVKERERLRQALEQLAARVYPSSTNFLLVRTEMPDLAERLREAGVLVSDVSNHMPPGFVRVSVGTPEENDVFLARYKKVCQSCD